MRIRLSIPEQYVTPETIEPVLEAVTRVNEHMIRAGQTPTSHALIQQGAIWRPEDLGDEHFDHGGTIAARGWGDCDDWAPLHAATLRATGEDPGARAVCYPSGPSTFHASVVRSSGELDDPSVKAGMKPPARVSGADGDRIQVWACDPHDGRIYQGQLIPAVAPLTLHCGIGFAVRGTTVPGIGELYEARCDVPIAGSPLVHVRAYMRHRAHRHRGAHVHGSMPYAIACSAYGATPGQAIHGALCGAIVCADAAELSTSVDRYKLLAVQAAAAGMSPGQVRDALQAQMLTDMQAAARESGRDPAEHSAELLHAVAMQGNLNGHVVIGDIFSDIAHAASGVVDAVSDVANDVAKAVSSVPWGDIVHDVQAAVSVVPGIGTAVSDVIAAAETAYDAAAAALSGNPLQGAIHAAYNFALGSVPGAAALHPILDPVVDGLIRLTLGHEPVESAVLNSLLDSVPDSPKLGPISPRSIAGSIAHLIVSHLGVKKTPGAPPPKQVPKRPPNPPAIVHAIHAVHLPAAPKPAAKPPTVLHPAIRAVHPAARPTAKPPGVPHAAIHTMLAKAPPALRPGSPGAPPGATHWISIPLPGGGWQSRWV